MSTFPIDLNDWSSKSQVARMLGTHYRRVEFLIQGGHLTTIQIPGGRVRVLTSDVAQMVQDAAIPKRVGKGVTG